MKEPRDIPRHAYQPTNEHCELNDQTAVMPGVHLLIDVWGVSGCLLTDQKLLRCLIQKAVSACNTTIIDIRLHSFGVGFGVTGVAILAESHMSIHTWPELSYAAIDFFTCGTADPKNALPIIESFLNPDCIELTEHKRGVMPRANSVSK